MKKQLSALFAIALTAILVAPQAADAAWWNPFSWFKKADKEMLVLPENARPDVMVKSPTTTAPVIEATTTPLKGDASTAKPLPVTAKPPVTTMPSQAKPVVKTVATTTPSKPVATTTSASKPQATTTEEKKVETPTMKLAYAYLPSNFSQPKNIRQGTELLALEASVGGSQAVGNWYIDSITWRIASDEMRSGDLTVGVSSKQSVVSDSGLINSPITTKLSLHAASDALSFQVNGNIPQRGRFHIVIDEVSGHMKSDPTNAVYKFTGTPIVGPEFTL